MFILDQIWGRMRHDSEQIMAFFSVPKGCSLREQSKMRQDYYVQGGDPSAKTIFQTGLGLPYGFAFSTTVADFKANVMNQSRNPTERLR